MSLRDAIRKRKHLGTRVAAVGQAGVNKQEARAKKAGAKGAAREAVKRVGEYKKGRVDYKPPIHGKGGK